MAIRRFSTALGAAFITSIGLIGNDYHSAQAIQLSDGTVYFAHPPQLVNAVTTFSNISSPSAIYYFTVTMPEDAGESLQRITLAQNEGGETVYFNLPASEAFEGARSHLGAPLLLTDVTFQPESHTVSLTFSPPIPPGKTVTIALHPQRNPSMRGTYLFGVTVYPVGEKAYGQFLGFGRFQIRRRGGV